MRFIDNRNITDPHLNLALEEYCLRNKDIKGDLLLFYVNRPSIIIGRNQNTIEEINSNFIRERNIDVVRRMSGGGAVYHDLGNLNFSFITDYDKSHFLNFKKFTEPVIGALKDLGVPAELTGRNDIVADGRKISGNAQFAAGKRMFSHGTLLFHSHMETVVEALNVRIDKIESKGLKSIRSRVANITEFLSAPMDMEGFKRHLLEAIFAPYGDVQSLDLTDTDWAGAERLAEEKYRTWDWNYGRSPDFNIRREHRFPIGLIDTRIQVEKGIICGIKIYGDFLGFGDVGDVEARLCGVRYDRDPVQDAVRDLDLTEYFGNLAPDAFAEYLTG